MNLHSSMDRLEIKNQNEYFISIVDLHSSMDRLEIYSDFERYVTTVEFTFQYG